MISTENFSPVGTISTVQCCRGLTAHRVISMISSNRNHQKLSACREIKIGYGNFAKIE
jgi:hypothetical protein